MTDETGVEALLDRILVEALLGRILDAEAIPQWWETPVPALQNLTPSEVWRTPDGHAKVLVVVTSYLDRSTFS